MPRRQAKKRAAPPQKPAATTAAAEKAAGTIYVDDREIERRTGIARITLQQWRQRRQGPPWIAAGRRIIYAWSDVVAWLEQRRVTTGAAA